MLKIVHPVVTIETPAHWISECLPLLEKWARTCYQSAEKMTPTTTEPFLRARYKEKHLGIFEHFVLTAKFICSRACSQQLVRHRIASYLQESLRYCKKGQLLAVVPPKPLMDFLPAGMVIHHTITSDGLVLNLPDTLSADQKHQIRIWSEGVISAHDSYISLQRTHSWRAEEARSVLPLCTKTEVIATMNLAQWMHVFHMRAYNQHAQYEIRTLMLSLKDQLCAVLPRFLFA